LPIRIKVLKFNQDSIKRIKRWFSKTLAIAEKNLNIELRFKYQVIISYIYPLISILMPIIIFGKFFESNIQFGPWNAQNYFVFIFIGYIINLMVRIINNMSPYFLREKYWKTLPILIIAPFNRFYFLIGYLISQLVIIIIPFIIFLGLIFIFYPISFASLCVIIFLFLGISLIFAGLSLILGVFAISNENISQFLRFFVSLIFWASCVTYPVQIFPTSIQIIINFNPIYYLIDIVRLTWIENNILYTITTHFIHFIIFLFSLIFFPLIGVLNFNYIYKKLGMSGY